MGENAFVGSRCQELKENGGENYKDGEMLCLLLSTMEASGKEKAESDF